MAIPVYVFAGFLESGKTTFIESVLTDPGFTRDERTRWCASIIPTASSWNSTACGAWKTS